MLHANKSIPKTIPGNDYLSRNNKRDGDQRYFINSCALKISSLIGIPREGWRLQLFYLRDASWRFELGVNLRPLVQFDCQLSTKGQLVDFWWLLSKQVICRKFPPPVHNGGAPNVSKLFDILFTNVFTIYVWCGCSAMTGVGAHFLLATRFKADVDQRGQPLLHDDNAVCYSRTCLVSSHQSKWNMITGLIRIIQTPLRQWVSRLLKLHFPLVHVNRIHPDLVRWSRQCPARLLWFITVETRQESCLRRVFACVRTRNPSLWETGSAAKLELGVRLVWSALCPE